MKSAAAILSGIRPVVLDVGAAFGLPLHLRVLEELADFLLFEPNLNEAKRLEEHYRAVGRDNVRVLSAALSGVDGKRTLHITNAPTGSSLLRPGTPNFLEYGEPAYMFPVREIEVETKSLLVVIREQKLPRLDFIKLDTQGTELEIIRGIGRDGLQKLLGVELEVGFPGGYFDQPGFESVDPFMRANGFELFDLRPVRLHRWTTEGRTYYPEKVFGVHMDSPTLSKRIWETDAVYFRHPKQLIEAGDCDSIRVLAAMYCVYQFFPEAHHLLEQAGKARLLAAAQNSALLSEIVSWHRQYNECGIHSVRLNPIRRVTERLRNRFRRLCLSWHRN
jgi:FkbM family methyltransferase